MNTDQANTSSQAFQGQSDQLLLAEFLHLSRQAEKIGCVLIDWDYSRKLFAIEAGAAVTKTSEPRLGHGDGVYQDDEHPSPMTGERLFKLSPKIVDWNQLDPAYKARWEQHAVVFEGRAGRPGPLEDGKDG